MGMRSVHQSEPPLVVHIIHRLAMGGLENGLVNLINHMPIDRFRHAIVCLTDFTQYREHIQRKDVPVIPLHKYEGKDLGVHLRLRKVLRNLCPDIIHTRNLPSLEYMITALFCGVKVRIHGEHGRDMYDLDGTNGKYKLMRKAIKPFVHHYTTVSTELAEWLVETVGVHPSRVSRIYNGVDLERFHPSMGPRPSLVAKGFVPPDGMCVGTVGRMEEVKDQLTLVRAFLHLLDMESSARRRLRLVIIGEGALRKEAIRLLKAADAEHLVWLPGERDDISEILRRLDLFVLPSLREGISNTILEAMASGLPVVATRVGGNPELVVEGETGMLVPPSDPAAMANAIRTYFNHPELLKAHGQAGRKRVEQEFSMEKMMNGYMEVYDKVLSQKRR
jgi:sugar transferase (PEP-CTERM/EpsH1 system associated)